MKSVHDWAGWGVATDRKLESIARMERWPAEKNYHIHRVYSVHAMPCPNDSTTRNNLAPTYRWRNVVEKKAASVKEKFTRG